MLANIVCLANSSISRNATKGHLYVVFQAVVEAKLCYAGPAWYGYTTAAERDKIEGFLRRAVRLGYRPTDTPTFDEIISNADGRLFESVIMYCNHPLSTTYFRQSAANSTICIDAFITSCCPPPKKKPLSITLTL